MTLLRRQVRSDAERGEVATPPEERQAAHSDGSVDCALRCDRRMARSLSASRLWERIWTYSGRVPRGQNKNVLTLTLDDQMGNMGLQVETPRIKPEGRKSPCSQVKAL